MIFFTIITLAPWRYLLGYLFARAFRYSSFVETSLIIFEQKQPQLHFNYQSHHHDSSGKNYINCFNVLLDYFLLTSLIFSSILFHPPSISTTFSSISSIFRLWTFYIISIVIISWLKWSDLLLMENWQISDNLLLVLLLLLYWFF